MMCKSWTNGAIFLAQTAIYWSRVNSSSHFYGSQSLVIWEKKDPTQRHEGLAPQVALGLGILRPEA